VVLHVRGALQNHVETIARGCTSASITGCSLPSIISAS
jgi:hypothetical protein